MNDQIKNLHYYKSIFAFATLLFIVVACSEQEKEVAPQVAEESTVVHLSARTNGLSITAPTSANWGVVFNVTVVANASASVTVSIPLTSKGKLTGITTQKADSKGNTTFKLSIVDKDKPTEEGLSSHTLSFVSNGVTETATINIAVPVGYTYSDKTGFRKPVSGSNNEKIYNTAQTFVGNSPASLMNGTGDTWVTDCAGGDCDRLSSAYTIYLNYRKDYKNPEIPANSSTTRTSLRSTLSTYLNGNDYANIVTKMASIYKANSSAKAPSGNQNVLTFFGIRGQCKETKDGITKSALSGQKTTQYNYKGGTTKTGSDVRAGMIFEWKSGILTHTGIVSDTYFDSKGVLTKVKVIESNFGSTFSNPGGQIPWERTVNSGREISLPDTKYRFAEY